MQGGSTITQQLVRNLYISRERTFTRKLREACLAVKLAADVVEAEDPDGVPEPDLLRQPGLRCRGCGADVLLEAREEADARAGRRCSPACRRRRRGSTRSPIPDAARARRKQVLRAMLSTGEISRRQYRHVVEGPGSAPQGGRAVQEDPPAVLLQLRARRARSRVRRGARPPRRTARVHDDRPAAATRRAQGDQGHALLLATIRPRPSWRSIPRPARSAR